MRAHVLVASLLVASALLLSGCAGGTGDGNGGGGNVKIVNMPAGKNTFEPKTLTIANGTTVRWTNAGTTLHTATADEKGPDGKPLFDSGNIQAGKNWEYTFTKPGTYAYHCIPHKGAGMVGTITVTA